MGGFNQDIKIDFNSPKDKSSIIKVIGVGGGGNNALQHMYERGIHGVDFIVLNTDAQALDEHSVSNKVQLGTRTTEGLGAGADPEVGEKAAIESMDDIREALGHNTKMVFITAGMGGGTGTGAAPVVAQVAKELGILTVAIVTLPFDFEGKRRLEQAHSGLEKLRENVDSLIIINNDRLAEQYPDLDYEEAFSQANEVLTNAAKGMAEVITAPFKVNIDFRDAKTVLENSGTALMSIGIASGENRAEDAVKRALDSPLLNDNKITGAKKVMLLILSGEEHKAKMNEIKFISSYIQNEAGGGNKADVIFGVGTEDGLGESIKVLVVATGFAPEHEKNTVIPAERIIHDLNGGIKKPDIPVVESQPVKETPVNDLRRPSNRQEVREEQKRQFFRLDNNSNSNTNSNSNFPTNSFLVEKGEEKFDFQQTTVLEERREDDFATGFKFREEEEPSFFEAEEEPVKEYDLFSYAELEPVSFTFDLEEDKPKEEDFSFQVKEAPVNFRVEMREETAPQKEEPKVSVTNNQPRPQTPKNDFPNVEQKEEFTIIEKKSTEEDSRIQERRNKLKEFNSSRFQGNDEKKIDIYEMIPAFRRRNIDVDFENPLDREQKISSFISENDKGKMEVRRNKFLNKDVD
ncbi:MAG: cell division protein FtsZ [Flavobacteriaceae bacterium]|nr:cell division protein FtsZ [Flavobacteriaceae bacterium]